MVHNAKCPKCGTIIQYDDKSVMEGCRDFEEINCSNCGNVVAHVFTDLVPSVRIVGNKDNKK